MSELKGATITNENQVLTQPLIERPKVSKQELELRKEVDKLKYKPHPLQQSGTLSALMFWWVQPFISIGNKTSIEQRMMPDVPVRDRVEKNEKLLSGEFHSKGSIGKSIIKMYKWNLVKNSVLMMITQACFCSLALFLYFLVDDVASDKWQGDERLKRYGLWYSLIVLTQFIGSMLYNYISCDLARIGIRLKNSVIFTVYRKILKISVLNPSQHTEGEIITYVQTDCQKVEDAISKFAQILESFWQIVFGYAICVYLIEYNVVPLILTFFILTTMTMYLYKYIIKYETQFMINKAKKLQLLKNVIKNVKYIKLKVWEIFYHAKIYNKREAELSALKKSNFVFSIVFFLNWVNPVTAICVTVLSVLLFNGFAMFQAARLLAFLKILTTILRGMGSIPVVVQFFLELKVSLKRLNTFLDTDEIKTDFIEYAPNEDNPIALELEFGSFYWNKLDEKLMKARRDRTRAEMKAIRGKIRNFKKNNIINNDDLILDRSEKSVIGTMSVFSSSGQSVNSVSRLNSRTLNGSFTRSGEGNIAFELRDLELALPKGQLTMIFGEIGSGKSSLFYSLLGEMLPKFQDPKPKLKLCGSVGYMGQKPWLMAKTIKENIILDLPYDMVKFDHAVKYSALDDDLKLFAEGENRILSENGENLSGGQRTRVEMARMLYQNYDVMFFDDPLSALDANVSNFLMDSTISRELKDKTRIIVTHAVQYLRYADCILLMEHGEIVFSGTYDQLKNSDYLKNFDTSSHQDQIKSPRSATRDKTKPIEKEANEVRAITADGKLDPILSKFASEDRTKGNISWGILHQFIVSSGGYSLFLLMFILGAGNSWLQIYGSQYLLGWASDFANKDKWMHFFGYCSIMYGFCFLAAIRFATILAFGILYSRRAHSSMIFRVLHAPVEEFIEKVSTGRLINRFTKDMDVLDKTIMKTTVGTFFQMMLVINDCIFMVIQLDVIIIGPLILYIIIAFWLQRRSMNVKRESVRMEAISKSPIVSWTAETIRGLPQIRSANKINYVTKNMIDLLHANMVNSVLSTGLDAWFKLRISMTNIFIVQIPCYCYMLFYKKDLTVQNTAMFLLLSTILTEDILRTLGFISDFEGNMVSIERISYFEDIPHEPHYYNFDAEKKKYKNVNPKVNLRTLTWSPSHQIVKEGNVVFQNVTARYGEDAEPVLKNLDFTVRSGEKIGIVGRTGAGKSSLIKLFWMSLAPSEGKVFVDGTDISKVDLKTLRNEVMVVSQDAALFQGTLAENIDPNMTEEDYPKAMQILEELGIKNNNIMQKGMACNVDAEGSNFSQGEKQIICYARTLINKKKLIILDEATANIDVKTEQAIKKIQESQFADSTMFIIAHRLKTVMHCDRIMVLKYGRIVEFDTPSNLLAMQNGLFSEMYNKMLDAEED